MEKKPVSSSSSSSSTSTSTSTSTSSFSFFFKRLNKKGIGSGAWRWKLKSSAGLRWKRRFNLHLWFVDDFLFKIVSVGEAIVLVSTLCFFFVCCGCHF
ncbi:hypothetical protein CDL12_03832 [Handroanthus impetiginosus]|uniref:Uncharacterized protein n=1 Tax=Handroanthus impetiginosus TaxID=429701 RepID=A0A2G9I132_9LAMI|nr:hypothetical protein CDL12_03832 [Handroanthus impetiginosus]